jgi:xylulokinase
MGLETNVIRAGNANMFLSPLFRSAFVNTIDARLELYDTDGAKGAALGAGVGAGIFGSFEEAFKTLRILKTEEPTPKSLGEYSNAYTQWEAILNKQIGN